MVNTACFDVGGTFIKYGVVQSDGRVVFKDKIPSPDNQCKEKIPEILIERTLQLRKDYGISSVGVSTAGQVDSEKGLILFASENLPDYTGTRLSYEIKRGTGMECYVENDVNAAALGELWMGAGAGADDFLCLTLGTGIGGAIIINRKLYKGIKGSAGEFGHIIINEDGRECNCGMKGCYERYASTAALIRTYAQAIGKSAKDISGEMIIEKVKSNDTIAKKVYNEFLDHVVTGLVNITHIFDTGLIIIGGGISSQGDQFFEEINKRFQKKAMPSYSEHTRIVQAKLVNDAGLIGACYIANNGA